MGKYDNVQMPGRQSELSGLKTNQLLSSRK
jgi:hypothetical protein